MKDSGLINSPMVQYIIFPKRSCSPGRIAVITLPCELALGQETEGQTEAQHSAPEISSRLKSCLCFKHGGFISPRLTALYVKYSALGSGNLYFTSGLLLTCWLILEKLFPLYAFRFPNLKNEGNYTDLFSELLWEQLKGEALYGLAGISKVRKPPNEAPVCLSCFPDLPSTS